MVKLLSALIFAPALSFGLGTVSSEAYACNDEAAAQAEDAPGLIQLAQDESGGEADEGTDEEGTDEEDSGTEGEGE